MTRHTLYQLVKKRMASLSYLFPDLMLLLIRRASVDEASQSPLVNHF